jgi:RNA polymerase sigma-70 factor, ECF subfamily
MSLATPEPLPAGAAVSPWLGRRPYPAPSMTHVASDPETARASASQALLAGLRQAGPAREAAIHDLHALLLRGAHHELGRRSDVLAHISRDEVDDLATQAADDALTAILAKLDTFRGASRFTTWAYKFVLLEAGVKARRRAWEGREVALEDDSWQRLADSAPSAQQSIEEADLLRAIGHAAETALTPHQREVFAALALNGVPIDVLAERLTSTRGALYKTLHDARQKLRAALADAGYSLHDQTGGGA